MFIKLFAITLMNMLVVLFCEISVKVRMISVLTLLYKQDIVQ